MSPQLPRERLHETPRNSPTSTQHEGGRPPDPTKEQAGVGVASEPAGGQSKGKSDFERLAGVAQGNALRSGIADEIARAYHSGNEAAGKAILWWLRVGDLLCEAKRAIPYGDWQRWVNENLPFGDRQERKYRRLAEHRDELAERNSGSVLSINDAIALLADPKEEAPIPASDNSEDEPATIPGEFARVAVTTAENGSAVSQINGLSRHIIEGARRALEHARNAGENLLNAKAALPDDEWLPWLAANTQVSEAQAARYMAVAEDWAQIQPKIESSALELLADALVGAP